MTNKVSLGCNCLHEAVVSVPGIDLALDLTSGSTTVLVQSQPHTPSTLDASSIPAVGLEGPRQEDVNGQSKPMAPLGEITQVRALLLPTQVTTPGTRKALLIPLERRVGTTLFEAELKT